MPRARREQDLLSSRHELLHEATLADRLSAAGALREIGRRLRKWNPPRVAFVREAALAGLASRPRERLQLRGIAAGVIEDSTDRSRLPDRP